MYQGAKYPKFGFEFWYHTYQTEVSISWSMTVLIIRLDSYLFDLHGLLVKSHLVTNPNSEIEALELNVNKPHFLEMQ